MKSKLLTIDTRDLINGLLIAFIAALISGVIEMIGNESAFSWMTFKPVLVAAISAALSYLLKSLATNSRNELFTREPASFGHAGHADK